VVDDISHEGLRVLLREEGVSFQRLQTWKRSRDPAFEIKKHRILHLYGLMDGTADVLAGDPDVVMCVDEFGPLNLQPPPGRQWTTRADGGPSPRRRRRATYTRPHGVRHLLAAYDLSRDKLYGHIKRRKRRGEFLTFLRYLRTLYPQPLSAARGPGHEGAPHAHRSHYPTPQQTGAGRHPGCRRSQPPGPRSPRLNLPVEPGVRDGRDALVAGPSCSKT
jgi:hypothetical protein